MELMLASMDTVQERKTRGELEAFLPLTADAPGAESPWREASPRTSIADQGRNCLRRPKATPCGNRQRSPPPPSIIPGFTDHNEAQGSRFQRRDCLRRPNADPLRELPARRPWGIACLPPTIPVEGEGGGGGEKGEEDWSGEGAVELDAEGGEMRFCEERGCEDMSLAFLSASVRSKAQREVERERMDSTAIIVSGWDISKRISSMGGCGTADVIHCRMSGLSRRGGGRRTADRMPKLKYGPFSSSGCVNFSVSRRGNDEMKPARRTTSGGIGRLTAGHTVNSRSQEVCKGREFNQIIAKNVQISGARFNTPIQNGSMFDRESGQKPSLIKRSPTWNSQSVVHSVGSGFESPDGAVSGGIDFLKNLPLVVKAMEHILEQV
ncbi:hypothetical protein C8R44DRAFT_752229 [Mycena epipterygia]|nr:hypothetical protein C8R44DRAFT_752229 [Mycena epipterygia]